MTPRTDAGPEEGTDGEEGNRAHGGEDGEVADTEPGDRRIRRRMELLEREGELLEILRRTRLTVPVWAAGVVFFVWTGWSTGSWAPALTLGAFAALATGVNFALRRSRIRDLREVRRALEALPEGRLP